MSDWNIARSGMDDYFELSKIAELNNKIVELNNALQVLQSRQLGHATMVQSMFEKIAKLETDAQVTHNQLRKIVEMLELEGWIFS